MYLSVLLKYVKEMQRRFTIWENVYYVVIRGIDYIVANQLKKQIVENIDPCDWVGGICICIKMVIWGADARRIVFPVFCEEYYALAYRILPWNRKVESPKCKNSEVCYSTYRMIH